MQFPALKLSSTFLAFVLLALTIVSLAAQTHPQPAAYSNLPLTFEANQGQTDPSVQFLARGQGYTLFLRPGEAVLASRRPIPASTPATAATRTPGQSAAATTSIARLRLIGSDPQAKALQEDQQITRTNYFLGNNPAKWRTNIPNYARIRYNSIYPGIDMVYYGNQRRLEHDFILSPGANPAKILFSLQGALDSQLPPESNHDAKIDPATGDLILASSTADTASELRLLKPIAYQTSNGARTEIKIVYKQLSNGSIGFTLGHYDSTRPLIIDPVLVFSTYIGGSGTAAGGDQANGIAVQALQGLTQPNNSPYIVGTTYSTDFPLSPDAHQQQNYPALASTGGTVFVSKFNADGTALLFSTYLGGSGGDMGYGIAVDSNDNAYITGTTYSKDFPVTCGAFQTTNPSTTPGVPTGFVAEIASSGAGLLYSTYLGGSGNHATPAYGDVAQAIAVGSGGSVYVTGYTWSADFPTTAGALQPNFAGTTTTPNAFVTGLNSTGSAELYSTYLGGGGSNGSGDYGNAIAIANGEVFVAGSTSSTNFPLTSAAYQNTLKGTSNAFVTALTPTPDSKAVFSTYLGGSATDSAQAIAIDAAGSVYVGGDTSSSDFPLTTGVVEDASVATSPYFMQWAAAAFVTKLPADGSTLTYSTYLEGVGTTVAGLAVDSSGDAYIAGTTLTIGAGFFGGFQVTPDALPTPASTGTAAYLVKLDPAAATFSYATLLGGSSSDSGTAIALYNGNAYITGAAASSDFPTTTGAFQRTNHALAAMTTNAFVTKLAVGSEANATAYATQSFTIPTSISGSGEQTQLPLQCFTVDYSQDSDSWSIGVTLTLGANGPPSQGFVYISDPILSFPTPWMVSTYPGVTTYYQLNDGYPDDAPWGNSPVEFPWSAGFSGDAVYAPSNTSGSFPMDFCPPPPGQSVRARGLPAQRNGHPNPGSSAAIPTGARILIQQPKFIPPAATPALTSPARPYAQSNSCGAPLSPLTVTLKNVRRFYGAANPPLNYSLSGVVNDETVTITPYTTAIAASAVGAYPISAYVGGPNSANYAITIVPGTLTIIKAPLYITARNVPATYGQTPPQPTSYFVYGFVNGDSASVVSGAPILTTTVTPTTPVGIYRIGVQTGTLTAENYYFNDFSNGEGNVQVYKAPLAIHPASFTIHAGDPMPAFTYILTGFVNGQTQSSATTGAATITTTAPTPTHEGRYYIIGARGTLQAQNYYFTETLADYGILTVRP